jgi:hypothetical protein
VRATTAAQGLIYKRQTRICLARIRNERLQTAEALKSFPLKDLQIDASAAAAD